MLKDKRQQIISKIIQNHKITNQQDLLLKLNQAGLATNQAAVSRDLHELGIFKIKGFYQIAQIESSINDSREINSVQKSGDNLIIIKTSPGKASAIAAVLDALKLDEIAGTLAGDDTLFVAVINKKDQSKAMVNIFKHFHK